LARFPPTGIFTNYIRHQSPLLIGLGVTVMNGKPATLFRQLHGLPHQLEIGLGLPVVEHHTDNVLGIRGDVNVSLQGVLERFQGHNDGHQLGDVVRSIAKKSADTPLVLSRDESDPHTRRTRIA
jgi:hypothetical protein